MPSTDDANNRTPREHDSFKPPWIAGHESLNEGIDTLELLKTSEARYRRLFETAQDGILLLDAKSGTITDVNPFMLHMLGYPREYFVGRELWEIGVVKNKEASRAMFRQLQEQSYVRDEDLPLETIGGHEVQVEFVSNVYRVGHSEVIQCNIRNITARKLAEAAVLETGRKIAGLHQAAHQLEIAEEEENVYRLSVQAAETILGFLTCSLYILIGDNLVVKAVSSDAVAIEGDALNLGVGGADLPPRHSNSGRQCFSMTRVKHLRAVCLIQNCSQALAFPSGEWGFFRRVLLNAGRSLTKMSNCLNCWADIRQRRCGGFVCNGS